MIGWNLPPDEIERRSFQIIDAEAPPHDWGPEEWRIIRRMIHTSADFDYVQTVRIHPRFIAGGEEAIRQGRTVMTDTRMVQAGISKRRLEGYGVRVDCLIDHPEVVGRAKDRGMTRAAAAVDVALADGPVGIYVVGNAPTALFRLLEHLEAGKSGPNLVVGLPVGFVNAAEAKEAVLKSPAPYLTALGRKGGSNVAASVINALADLIVSAETDKVRTGPADREASPNN